MWREGLGHTVEPPCPVGQPIINVSFAQNQVNFLIHTIFDQIVCLLIETSLMWPMTVSFKGVLLYFYSQNVLCLPVKDVVQAH